MSNDTQTRKLSYQLQQMAFQKYPFQINNKTFFCLQTYFQDQLLNGVDLQIKEAKGMTSQPQKISYIAQTQQIILPIGSNIISYNAQKRAYSLVTEVNGYVEILRTYTSKIHNRTYLFWLEADQEGLNMDTKRKGAAGQSCGNNNNGNNGNADNSGKAENKITSIWNLGRIGELMFGGGKGSSGGRKSIDKVKDDSDNSIGARHSGEKGSNNQNDSPKKPTPLTPNPLTPTSSTPSNPTHPHHTPLSHQQKSKQKSRKKVRIQAPQQQQQTSSTQKKRMRICIFDYQKKLLIHKQPLQIQETQTITQIFLYFITQKMVGYIINDETEQRAKIYYKKVKVDESYCLPKSSSRRMVVSKKKVQNYYRKPERFNVLDSIFQVPLLKYNGETDQYLFRDTSTVYSLQVYQVEHQLQVQKLGGSGSSKGLIKNSNVEKNRNGSRHQLSNKHLPPTTKPLGSQHSIQISDDSQQMDQENLSKEIEKITNKIITSSRKDAAFTKQKHAIRINEQIELFTDETIIDISISQVYLVVLTNEFIRFYSIFNLNTLLFKSQIHDLHQNPPPSSVQLNKSYLLLTHENSTLVSSYTILERRLKYNSTCEVEIEHCQGIVRLFMNSYNCEVGVVARQFEIEGRMTNILKSKKVIQNNFHSYKKTYIDISLAYINFSSTKCQTKALYLKNQRFKNILTCKWHSQYLIETQNQILGKQWRQAFENLKCSCLHPTGQYLIIGFNDCFKIYAVTQEGLQNTYMSDGVKDCQAIAYSEYGESFAVGSGNAIGIYNSYNCSKKLVVNLPMGSLVESLEYRSNHLICILRTKRVIIYHTLLDYKQIFTFNPKNYLNQNKHELQKRPGESVQNLMALTIKGLVSIDVNSLYYDLELNVIIFSSGKKIFFLNTLTSQSLGSYDVEGISCMEYNKHLATLFLGTFSGELIAFPWPNKPSNILSDLPRFKFHSQKITKIKLTSDFKYLITLGHDMSIYKSHISYILNLKRLKGTQIAEYKGNKNAASYCNFLFNKGVCQFSHSQAIEKQQAKKQLEQEVVNTVFMLPQERLKQKEHLFEQISTTKEELQEENMREYEPLQQESISLRNRIQTTKDQIIRLHRYSQFTLQKEKEKHAQETSKLLKIYSEINYDCRLVRAQLDEQKELKKNQYRKQYEQLVKQQQEKERTLIAEIQAKRRENETNKQDFLEIDLIEEEKRHYLEQQLAIYQKEFEQYSTKNGQLSCKNSSIEKEISVLKYRIEELKFVIVNANQSIQKLKDKRQKETEEKLVFQNLLVQNAKIDVSEMQKKYIKATKQLIEKNKVIDINLNQYEKEKQILVRLEKTVEGTEGEIDNIVDNLQQEKEFMKELANKKEAYTQRYKEVLQVRNSIKLAKSKGELELKKFIESVQQLQKQLQMCVNQNKKEQCEQTMAVVKKLRQLQNFGSKKKVVNNDPSNAGGNSGQRSIRQSAKGIAGGSGINATGRTSKSGNNGSGSMKNVVVRSSDVIGNGDNSTNPLKELLGQLKKTSSIANNNPNLTKSSKKSKKQLRCSTQGPQTKRQPTPSSTLLHPPQQQPKSKSKLKINHHKFKEEFAKFRKDDCLNKSAGNGFRFQTDRQEGGEEVKEVVKRASKKVDRMGGDSSGDVPDFLEEALEKKSSTKRYHQSKTEANYQTERFLNSNRLTTLTTTKPIPTFLSPQSPPPTFPHSTQRPHHSPPPNLPCSSYQQQKQIAKQKQQVYKKLSTQQKLLNKINNEKKLFMTSKRRLHMQNQDLIGTYNSLTYDNKYFRNVLRVYEQALDEEDENYVLNSPTGNPKRESSNKWIGKGVNRNSDRDQVLPIRANPSSIPRATQQSPSPTSKPHLPHSLTPFQKYVKNKETKMTQLKNCPNEFQSTTTALMNQTTSAFKPSLSMIPKNANNGSSGRMKTSQQLKRVKTVPCVEFTL